MADILLIEDMSGVQRAITSMLKGFGHSVIAVGDGAQGLDMLKRQRFDLVITDMMMPELDGSEVLAQLRASANRTPVIAISGGGAGISADMALRAAKTTADAYLEKPFERADLQAVVDRLLAKVA